MARSRSHARVRRRSTLTVSYAIGGTAQNFFDYQSISGSVTIPAGQTSATVTITPVADASIEGNETVILTINPSPTTYLVGAASSATVTIADGVPNTVSIAATTPNASETGPVSGAFTFTRTGPTTFDVTVSYAIGGTAQNFFDYQSISGSVTIPAGQTSATVTITPVADASIEGNETVILTINPSPTTYLVGASSSATVTIADGVPNTVSIAATTPNASETGPVSGVFTFTRTGPTTFDVTVSYAIGGTAQNFFDYQSISGERDDPCRADQRHRYDHSRGRQRKRPERNGDPHNPAEPDDIPRRLAELGYGHDSVSARPTSRCAAVWRRIFLV